MISLLVAGAASPQMAMAQNESLLQPTNVAPVAVDDEYTTPENSSLAVPASGVLENDTDDDFEPIFALIVTGPSNGDFNLNIDGSFFYSPDPGFSGIDTFTYKANDTVADSNIATVTINVTDDGSSLQALNDEYGTAEDVALSVAAPGVIGNDIIVEPESISAQQLSGPSSGSLTLNADGSFVYAPNAGFSGVDNFTYRVDNGSAQSNEATVSITVASTTNVAPRAADDAYSTTEGVALTVAPAGVLENDNDENLDPLAALVVDTPDNGSFTLNLDGSFVYTPDAGFSGTDSFIYKANDGDADSNFATVTITVIGINNAPVAEDDDFETTEGVALTVDPAGVLENDSDDDQDPLFALLVNGPSNGSVNLNINGSFVYTPDAGFSGTDSFTYKVNDGTVDSGVATVTIAVAPNQSAFATCGDISIFETAPGVYTAPDFDGNLIVGTNSYDWIFSTSGADLILGLDSFDVILGRGGSDLICSGDGIDFVRGDSGDDTIYGGADRDSLSGGTGDDRIFGGPGRDDLFGDSGRDVIYGGPDMDVLLGGSDDDALYGEDATDFIFGQSGNDLLNGGNSIDFCRGGWGSDAETDCEYYRSGTAIDEIEEDGIVDEAEARKANDENGLYEIQQPISDLFLPMIVLE